MTNLQSLIMFSTAPGVGDDVSVIVQTINDALYGIKQGALTIVLHESASHQTDSFVHAPHTLIAAPCADHPSHKCAVAIVIHGVACRHILYDGRAVYVINDACSPQHEFTADGRW